MEKFEDEPPLPNSKQGNLDRVEENDTDRSASNLYQRTENQTASVAEASIAPGVASSELTTFTPSSNGDSTLVVACNSQAVLRTEILHPVKGGLDLGPISAVSQGGETSCSSFETMVDECDSKRTDAEGKVEEGKEDNLNYSKIALEWIKAKASKSCFSIRRNIHLNLLHHKTRIIQTAFLGARTHKGHLKSFRSSFSTVLADIIFPPYTKTR